MIHVAMRAGTLEDLATSLIGSCDDSGQVILLREKSVRGPRGSRMFGLLFGMGKSDVVFWAYGLTLSDTMPPEIRDEVMSWLDMEMTPPPEIVRQARELADVRKAVPR